MMKLKRLVLLALFALLAVACGVAWTPAAPTSTPSAVAAASTRAPDPTAPQAASMAGQALTFRRLTLDDGLSQSSINCIVQDPQGFMWFGTQDGLNRYDGYEFHMYRRDPDDPYSLSHSYIVGCERDQRGVMWVVTRDGTLHRHEPETDRFLRYDLELEDPFQQMGSAFTALLGDRQGQLWIGTFGDGVIRYDPEGDSFTTYRPDPDDATSLSHRIVNEIYEGRDGTIWVGTEGGLNRYEPETDSFVRYPYRDFPPDGYQYDPPVHPDDPAFQPDNPDALASPAVTALLEDREERLWVGTRYGGLNQLDRGTGDFIAYPFDPAYEPQDPNTFSGNSVRALLEDHMSRIWVSSAHWKVDETRTYARLGLERFDPRTGAVTRYRGEPDDPCGLPHEAVLRMYEDRRDTLWIHTFGGGVEIYVPPSSDQASECFIHHGHDPTDAQTLSGDGITRFYEDDAGGLWIGTETGGITYYDPTWAKFPHYRISATGGERLSNNSIWHIAPSPRAVEPNGRVHGLWVATFAGLNYWDRDANTFTFYEIDPQLPDVIAYGIFEDVERQKLWLGTMMGLERADLPSDLPADGGPPAALNFTRVLTRESASTGFVLDLHPAGEGQLWLAHYRVGLSRFDLATEAVVATYRHDPEDPSSLSDARIVDIFPGLEDTLWLVTRSGVDRFDPATETFTHYPHDPDNPEGVAERILSLYQDTPGRVWLGTDGDGLQRLDLETGQVTITYREAHGLPNNVVYSILPDAAGHLWLTTNRGLSKFDPEREAFRTYTSDDGLQSNEFNLGAEFRASDGELFFGGINGLNAFYPQEIAPHPYQPPIVITDISLGPPEPPPLSGFGAGASATEDEERDITEGKAPHAVEQVALTYQDRLLSFQFAALHYAIPARNQYAYRMEGFDEGWNYVGNLRFATYTQLPPGRYTFRVIGTNSDGVWNERGAAVAVTIAPPFWATWWFRGVVGVLIVSAAATVYRLRVRTVEARSRELARQVAERTRELAAVNAIAAVVSRSLDLDRVLADALAKTLELMNIEAGGIYLLDRASGVLTIAAHQGLSPGLVAEIDRLKMGEGFSGHVVMSGEPLVVRDITEDTRLTRLAVEQEGLRSLTVVPIGAKGEVSGTLFAITRGYREFSDREVQLLASIGNQIGVAVENARLFAGEQRRAEQFQVLSEVGRRTTSILSTDELLNEMVSLIREGFGYDVVEIGLVEGDELVFSAGVGRGARRHAGRDQGRDGDGVQSFQSFRVRVGEEGVTGEVAATGVPVLVPDVNRDERFLKFSENATCSELAVPIKTKDEVIGVLNVQCVELDAFDASDLAVLQALADQAGTAIVNAQLFEAEQRRAEQFRVISEVGSHITSILAVDELLDEIARLIQEAFGYYHVGIGLVEGDEVAYRVGAGALWEDPGFRFEPARLDVGKEGITGWVAATGEPLLVPDVSQDPRYVWMRPSETHSELTVPLKVKGKVIGVLDVQSDQLDAFDESDLLVLQSLAYQAAIAIENARLYEQARRLAVIEERQRLARELHDSVTQALYGVSLYAEAAARRLNTGATDAAIQYMHDVRDTAQEALREMRLLIFELRPSVLESEGVVAALRARLESVEERAGLGVSFRVEGDIALASAIEEGLYRIAREALNNALKHAAAQNISVSLKTRHDAVVLEIVDDGVGFDASAAVNSGGLGLEGMRERAAQIGGEISLESEPGGGTRVRVEVAR